MISTAELHWAAGFMDGEGSFGAYGTKSQPVVQVSQKYPHSLEKLKRLFGGNLYTRKKYGSFSGSTPTDQVWVLNSRAAAAVMMTLYVLLSPYRQGQIERALAKWRSIPAGSGNGANNGRKKALDAGRIRE